MKLIAAIKSLIYALYKSIKRFPVTIGLTTAISIILIIIRQLEANLSSETLDNLFRLLMVLSLGIPLSLCIKLAFENYLDNTKAIFRIIVYIAAALALVLYYLFLIPNFSMITVTRYVAFSIALYLGFFFIPYLPQRKSNFEHYVIRVLSDFVITVIYSAVLFGGLAAIMFTLDKLLSVPMKGSYYYYVWLIIAGVFAPSHFLGNIPNSQEQSFKPHYSKPLKVLLLYIIMPIITAYTIILYLYFAKIIVTLQWPVGLVSHLVLWFSLISTGVVFFISPLHDENKWVKTFIFWFTKLLMPLLIMMFVSLSIRIRAYGVTENRYYVLVLGIWVLAMMIYLNFTNGKKNILLPISLALVAILSVTGPWSSYSVSKYSQNNRFEAILLNNGMLQDSNIIKKKTDISDKDKTEISQILSYFHHNHDLSNVRYLPEGFRIENMEEVFGFSYQTDYYGNQVPKYFNYSTMNWSVPIDISGYDYLIDNRILYSDPSPKINNMEFKYNTTDTSFQILSENDVIYSKSLSDFAQQLYNKFGLTEKQQINIEDMQFIEESENLKLKFIIINIFGRKGESDLEDNVIINSVDFYVLVKVK